MGIFVAVGSLALATLASGAPGGEPAVRQGPRAPQAWRAYPLNQVNANLADQAQQDACDFEAHQSGRRRGLLIFLVGRVSRQRGDFGVGPNSNFHPNNRIYRALLKSGRAYADCRSGGHQRVDVAYGVTNYKLSSEISSNRGVVQAGRAQAHVARKLARHFPNGVGAAAAGDIELGWDRRGSSAALNLAHGAAGQAGDYYNFGTPGHCPPFGRQCQGNWSPLDVGRASQDKGTIALPEVYYPKQAQTWARIAARWDRANCPERRRHCFDFGGVTGTVRGCNGAAYTPRASWLRMRKATKRRVGRRLIQFNPRRVGCRKTAQAAADNGDPVGIELPLMSVEVPAEMIKDPDPIANEYEMSSLQNAWRAGTRREYVVVYAGAGGLDPQTGVASPDGRIVVMRESYSRTRPVERSIDEYDVPGAGAVRIAEAPKGLRAAESSVVSGRLRIEGSGVDAVLDLGSGELTLSR